MKNYTLVYQAGIANVFSHANKPTRCSLGSRKRVMQADFKSCENFCRGLIEAGAEVTPAWCNMAGDVSLQDWNYSEFDLAPFCEHFTMVRAAALTA